MHTFPNLSALRRLQDVSWIMYKGSRKNCCFMVLHPLKNDLSSWVNSPFSGFSLQCWPWYSLNEVISKKISLSYILECTVFEAFLIYLLFGDIRFPYFSNTLEPSVSSPSLKIIVNECEVNQREQNQSDVLHLMSRPEHIHNWQENKGDK